MDNQTISDQSPLSLGEQLRRAREKLNISIDEVAAKLNLRSAIIQAIENDEFVQKSIPSTFMKGYVRNYAKFLKLPDGLLTSSMPNFAEEPKNDLNKNSRTKHSVNPHAAHSRWVGYLTTLVVLFVAGMTALWWWENYQQSNNERDNLVQNYVATEDRTAERSDNVVEIPAIQTIPEASTPVPEANTNESVEIAPVVANTPVVTNETQPVQQTAEQTNTAQAMLQQHSTEPEQAQPTDNETTEPATVTAGDLQIEVTGVNCWISVKDAKRKVLAQKEYKQGEILTFNEGSPYSVIIGAPGNVKITYKGEAYPLKVDGRVAKFKLQ
ncbi:MULTISPECIES: RodZ domain-containing protein [Basfia]|uniref:HTH cro/C1-type domain-containing protein n=2 Tax=Basfia TaxID=697331 RepID=Q65R85_MANSM|nr:MULTISPECIES: RodZ family helix-turn-helix domain-containing protein [Basfia]AAU38525.1 unknown [[Mannheimia] succiniciproducens MBEL55E]QIM69133.1 DNA-binding protein [Basfia succiniciproducens]SCY17963.1 cytoskeleton protein RodZ [Basfia succiniciproducens]